MVRTLTIRAQQYVTFADDRRAKPSHVCNALRADNNGPRGLTENKKQVTSTNKTTTKSSHPILVLCIYRAYPVPRNPLSTHGNPAPREPIVDSTICSISSYMQEGTPVKKRAILTQPLSRYCLR